ncbi:uncharacterized protein LOC132178131 [Corylus avellana]|uniref:uncharacterized protein LOC132178131 n=1 Tax=Corylus avellana TaxID=13451 RepID=UPI00286A73B8|nr:uncharacterized protein LOC132178131 [Corylus avellana]
MEIKGDPAFKWPTKMRTPSFKRTNQRWCEYHNDRGHLTEDCISQRHEIENFIRNGKLVRFLAGERNRGRDPQEPLQQNDNEAPERRQDDHVLSKGLEPFVYGYQETPSAPRGLAGGGESNLARKAHARRVNTEEVLFLERPSKTQEKDPMILSFSEEDAKGVAMPHDDVLMVQPVGLISLPVTAGTAPKQATIIVDFLVVDRPFAYNTSIGRPSLNKLRAITLTYHLKMKFLTEDGVGEVRGD